MEEKIPEINELSPLEQLEEEITKEYDDEKLADEVKELIRFIKPLLREFHLKTFRMNGCLGEIEELTKEPQLQDIKGIIMVSEFVKLSQDQVLMSRELTSLLIGVIEKCYKKIVELKEKSIEEKSD